MRVGSKSFIEVDDERGAVVNKDFGRARRWAEDRSEREEEREDDMRDRRDQ
jgi:hypothetical protein